ncbi:MAG: tetratricopeptide repeat protein [Planctomycetes bacterium]|nr:tetratricopeptide repeat protein [Planctomycetota bacterium]
MPTESREAGVLLRAVACLGVPVLLIAAVFVVFAPALDASFLHWDDDLTVTQNFAFRGFGRESVAWMFSTGLMGHFQPLAWMSFALDHALEPLLAPDFLAARQFHRTNLIGHAACAVAVYWASLEILSFALRRKRLDPAVVFASAFATFFFAVHPLRVESVAWVTERRDVISGTFFALALVAWMRYGRAVEGAAECGGRLVALGSSIVAGGLFFASVERGATSLTWRGLGPLGLGAAFVALFVGAWFSAPKGARGPYLAALACLLLSLGAKAWGMVLPVLFLLLDVRPLGRIRDAQSLATCALEKLPFVAVALGFASLAAWAQGLHAYTQPDLAAHTVLERIAQAGFGVVHYPWKTLWPVDLLPIVSIPDRLPIVSARFGLPLSLAIVLGVVACIGLFKQRASAVAWCAYLATIAPVLGFLQSGPQLVADRYTYLALLPLTWLVASLFARAFARGGILRVVVVLAAVAWVGALGSAAHRQTRAWRDDLTLWSYAHAVEPDAPEIQKQLAFAYIQEARAVTELSRRFDLYVAAGDLLERALPKAPDARLFGNLALVHRALVGLDLEHSDEHAELALSLSQRAIEEARKIGLDDVDYRSNHAAILVDQGRFAEAAIEFEAVTREKPTFGWGWMNLGIALSKLERHDESRAAFRRAAELLPREKEAWLRLGAECEALNDRDGARAAHAQVLTLSPEDATARAALERLR